MADVGGPDRRLDRWLMRAVLWREAGVSPSGKVLRTRTCGRHSVHPAGHVGVRSRDGVAGFAHLHTCGSVWLCPVCNAKIQATRRVEVHTAIAHTLHGGGGAAFGAYTLRHRAGHDGDALWRSLSKCWQAVTRDRGVRDVRAELGVVGIVRAAEVTHGRHGWHPHLHPLILTEGPLSDVDVERLHAEQDGAWRRAAERLGLQAPVSDAQHLHRLTGDRADEEVARYFTKAAWEMTSTQTKSETRASGSQTPWDLLRAVAGGDADALDLWHDYERISHGKRAISWSRGLRVRVGLDVERTDEDLAGEEVGTADDTVCMIRDWAPFRHDPSLGPRLLRVLEGAGTPAAVEFLDRHGIDYVRQ